MCNVRAASTFSRAPPGRLYRLAVRVVSYNGRLTQKMGRERILQGPRLARLAGGAWVNWRGCDDDKSWFSRMPRAQMAEKSTACDVQPTRRPRQPLAPNGLPSWRLAGREALP